MTPTSILAAMLVGLRLVVGMLAPGVPAYGTYAWPVQGPVIRGYEPPPNPYASGHRGIDIAVPYGTTIAAPLDGTVAFAGSVAGSLFISIDHPDGVRTTYSWLSSIAVKKGDLVATGATIGATGWGHPGILPPHLHFGAKVGADYLDPMLLLVPQSVVDLVHLAPMSMPWVSPDVPVPSAPRMGRLASRPSTQSNANHGRRLARPPPPVRAGGGARTVRRHGHDLVARAPGRT